MGRNGARILLGKVVLAGKIELKSGMHIGGSKESMQIGGVDLPVIKDSATNQPYIPGSSLKGKLRSSLEKIGKRETDGKTEKLLCNRNIGAGRNPVFIHCCDDVRQAMKCEVCRIFGSSGDDAGVPKGEKAVNYPSLLMVRDCPINETFVEMERVEVKTETGIDRLSMAANPRQVERVVPDTSFAFEMVYSVEGIELTDGQKAQFPSALTTDLNNLLNAMAIVESEGIGGYSSRGYGKVIFQFTEFRGRSTGYYRGDSGKQQGKEDGEGFPVEKARTEIKGIVDFLKKESANVVSG
jgi:CRISPR-associated protein Csm3